MRRRDFVGPVFAGAGFFPDPPPLRSLVIGVQALVDQGAHSGKGLGDAEVSRFDYLQEIASREFSISGIVFDIRAVEGGYLRTQGYSQIPEKFLARDRINLFVTHTLGYDVDRDRTGGASIGPRPRGPHDPGSPFYVTFLGLGDASDTTLPHEYAHHFTLDTRRSPSSIGNLWADLRNDYWLWRQRHGTPIAEFRACAASEWARWATR